MTMKEIFDVTEQKMNKTLAALGKEFASIRAGRANPAVLDRIMVSYYGADTPINQLASVSVTEARTLTIQPWDGSVCRAIEKAIQASDLGINPQSDGRTIRIVFPPLTEERRRALTKDIAKLAEESKVALRSVRRDAMEKLKAEKKNSVITEDDLKSAEKTIQDLTDKFCKQADALCADKEKEIMSI